ncbi:MAG: hypothetical protein ACTHKM_04420 [Tsuneonella sp.]
MRAIRRFNPGPGIADFWHEFRRPNPYRWPVLGGSALLTGCLLFLLTGYAVYFNLLVAAALAVVAGVVLFAFLQEHVRLNWSMLIVAALITGVVMWQFMKERVVVPPPPPEVTYISTFEAGRTDAQIEASNVANQKLQDKLSAEQAKRENEVKDAYRALGRATGLDVDAMEKQIKAQQAAEARPGGQPADTAVAQPAH